MLPAACRVCTGFRHGAASQPDCEKDSKRGKDSGAAHTVSFAFISEFSIVDHLGSVAVASSPAAHV